LNAKEHAVCSLDAVLLQIEQSSGLASAMLVLGSCALALEIFADWMARRGAGPTSVWMFRRAGQVLLALDLCAMVIIASAHTAHLVRSCWAMT
jgi:hypothetical protein